MPILANSGPFNRYTGWLPHPVVHQSFLEHHLKAGNILFERGEAHVQMVQEFESAIKSDPTMVGLFDDIFLQVSSENIIPNFDTLLYILDNIVVGPPKVHTAKDPDGNVIAEPVGVPIYLLFDLLSNTSAGYELFRLDPFNYAIKALLDSWGDYLRSDGSNSSLTNEDEGWFSPIALESLESDGRGDFNATYVTPDPDAVNRGYRSWDEFFTREVQSDARPVLDPDNKSLIHSPCESTVYRIATDIKKHDRFWLKTQSYSLHDMFDRDDDLAQEFIGGTVYQGFLRPQDYHRWRAPVDGTVIKVAHVPGTYYAVLPDAGAEDGDPDLQPGDPHGALIRSQAWRSTAATRALIFIEADNKDIGLFCFISVGMVEMSTCEVTVQEGQHVNTGDELGMFHFGGSTHALVFGPQAKITFGEHVQVDNHQKVNSVIAEVAKAAE